MTWPRVWLSAAALAAALGFGATAGAQSRPAAGSPAAVVSFDAYAAQVRRSHPIARQARLVSEQARAEQQVARGAFDPVLSAAWDRKTFGSTEYYDYAAAKLTVPTPLGVDMVVGYERADGRYISPDRRTPTAGLLTAGFSVPIGQRIVTDERRTALAVARALRTAADAERDAAANRLVLQAAKDYATWYDAWRRAAIATDGLALAEFRLDAVRRRVRAGESAAIDTVEAGLEVERRGVQREEAAQALYAARLRAEANLWGPAGQPAVLPEGATPTWTAPEALAVDSLVVQRWVSRAVGMHPDARRASARVEQAAAQRRFAGQQLLPAVELQAAALAEGGAGGPAPGAGAADNAKIGATAKLPLLLLRERGRLSAASAREEQQEVDRARVARDVGVAIRTAANDVAALDRLLAAQRRAAAQARLLRDAEQRRFEAGESTLFLVNARERTVLDEATKLAAIEAKRLVAGVELGAALGDPATLGTLAR